MSATAKEIKSLIVALLKVIIKAVKEECCLNHFLVDYIYLIYQLNQHRKDCRSHVHLNLLIIKIYNTKCALCFVVQNKCLIRCLMTFEERLLEVLGVHKIEFMSSYLRKQKKLLINY